MEYKCNICGLHYRSEELAKECYDWCSKHDSCKLEVAEKSIEAMEARKYRQLSP